MKHDELSLGRLRPAVLYLAPQGSGPKCTLWSIPPRAQQPGHRNAAESAKLQSRSSDFQSLPDALRPPLAWKAAALPELPAARLGRPSVLSQGRSGAVRVRPLRRIARKSGEGIGSLSLAISSCAYPSRLSRSPGPGGKLSREAERRALRPRSAASNPSPPLGGCPVSAAADDPLSNSVVAESTKIQLQLAWRLTS